MVVTSDDMWCERVLRNAADATPADWGGRCVDYVDLEWNECGRIMKKSTRAGEAVRALLALGKKLRHGDVLFEDASRTILVNVLPCDVIVAEPQSGRHFALLALELGNLHWPTQVSESHIIFIEDGPPMEAAAKLSIPWSREVRRFEPATVVTANGVRIATDFRIIRRPCEKAGQPDPVSACQPARERAGEQ